MNTPSLHRVTGIFLIIQMLLMFVPIAILGSAINWPASLSQPAANILPLIREQASAVRLGYLIYLIYSILFWPTALLTARVVAGNDTYGPLLRIAVGFGIASAVARTLGIIRWLVAMPALARLYTDPATSEATRETITVVYHTFNDYAGSVGEVLGVSFFAALWVALVSVAILRSGVLPRWLGYFGLVAAAALFLAIVELFGVDLGPLMSVSVVVIHFWFLAAGVVLLKLKATQPGTIGGALGGKTA